MKIKEKEVQMPAIKGDITIQRKNGGIPYISATHEIDLHYGLGYMHGYDRQLYIYLLKLIGEGRSSEELRGSEDLIEIDKYMRWIDLTGDVKQEIAILDSETQQILESYCKGVNDAISQKTPTEFKLVKYKPEPWTPEDVALMGRMIGFVGLAQAQGDMEKFIIQMIKNKVDPVKIKELFPYLTEEISEELREVLWKTEIYQPIIDKSLKWITKIPSFTSSNNWAVSPEMTASGKAIMCGDPHLELRLPSIWYNAVMKTNDFYMEGATVPGVPSIALGRTNHLAWAVTYGTMDLSDYFIEEVKGESFRRGDKWVPFTIREEILRPKKGDPIKLKFYENLHGILEGEPHNDGDGYYLNYALSSRRGQIAQSLESLVRLPKAQNVKDAMELFSKMTFAPFNWVMADSQGNIGYQLGGIFPNKADNTSGLVPYFGWDENNDWKGMIDPKKYPKEYNPERNFIITTNQDLNHLGEVNPMNLPMSNYRVERITELLTQKKNLTVEDMKEIQYDVYSIEAQKFMKIIAPLLPNTENGEILRNWDLKYDVKSLGATLFERIYHELLLLVFGENGIGRDVMENVIKDTPLFAFLHGFFDNILLNERSSWFNGKAREKIFKLAIKRGLEKEPKPYGHMRKIIMKNLFFGGNLPSFLGFDIGPIELRGSRATVSQGQLFKLAGKESSFAPTYRMITDFKDNCLHTNIAGGPSDRRFSKYYKTQIKEWLEGEYKILSPEE
jgi:penicillin amidase